MFPTEEANKLILLNALFISFILLITTAKYALVFPIIKEMFSVFFVSESFKVELEFKVAFSLTVLVSVMDLLPLLLLFSILLVDK